jgi:predicted aspartyl protease
MLSLRLFLWTCILLLPARPAFSKQCPVVHIRLPTPADTALQSWNLNDAERLYAAELEKNPTAEVSLSGLILSQLYQNKTDAALATAQDAIKRLPSSATLVADLAQIQFRTGDLAATRASLLRAMSLDQCNARVYFVFAAYLKASSMKASARERINTAHQLSPDDPQIYAAWLADQPKAIRIASLKKKLETADLSDREQESLSSRIERLETVRKAEAEHGRCKVVSTAPSMKLPFSYIMDGPERVRAFALDVRINDKATARLQIDTGASGILIRRGLASKAGLVPLIHNKIYGIGDEGSQTSYFALADDLKIGQFEFKNCVVEVSDKRSVANEDGLIGGDVFEDYLLTIDFPERSIKVDPLPRRPGEKQEVTISSEGEADGEASPLDAYVDPSMKDWTHVLRLGHDLMVPATLGDSKTHWFILDTGAFATTLSPATARAITKVSRDRDRQVEGLSGKVKEVFAAKNIEITFGGVRQKITDAVVFNIDNVSSSTGVEASGFLGFGTLRFLVMQIDYRDGVVHFEYDPKHGENRRF